MPTLIAAITVLVLVVPGFLLRAGYLRSRARTTPDADLYAFAEAITGSLFFLAILWPWHGESVLHWTEQRTLFEPGHSGATYEFLLALFGLPYPVGLAVGLIVVFATTGLERLRRRFGGPPASHRSRAVRLVRALDRVGLARQPTVWDDVWFRLRADRRSYWIRIRTTAGDELYGMFATESRVGTSPAPRQVYLEQARQKRQDGSYTHVKGERGIYVDAESIVSIEFAEARAKT